MTVYSSLYHQALWPLYGLVRGRPGPRLLKEANDRQWLSAEALRAFQWTELQTLLRHAYEFSPWYRDRFTKLGLLPEDIRTAADFRKVPTITKDEIRAHREQMHAGNYLNRTYEHKTGGSTGQPLQFYVDWRSYDWRVAMSMRGYGWAGYRDAERQFYVWGAPIGTPPLKARLKTRLHNAILRKQMFSSFGFSRSAMSECASRIDAFRPRTIVGYTSALCMLAQHLLDDRKTITAPGAIITAAEGVNAQQRLLLERAFRAPVFSSYGSREFMLIAMECERHNGLHLSMDNLYVEVLSGDRPARDGEVGEVVVTDLHNFGMPFIRYKIGDLAALSSESCACGRGLSMLVRVEGRALDAIRTRDGRIVPGEFFPHLLKEFTAVKQFQVVQKSLDEVHVKLVLHDGDNRGPLARMQDEFRKVLGPTVTVHCEHVTEIPLTASGKFRVTVSEL